MPTKTTAKTISIVKHPMEAIGTATQDYRDRALNKAEKRNRETTKAVTVEVPANHYGTLTAAALVHECTVGEALALLISQTDHLCEWHNEYFLLT